MEILSEKFKNILKKIDETIKKQLSNVEKDASIGAVDIGSALSSLSGELRSLVPEGFNHQIYFRALLQASVKNLLQLDLIWILSFLMQRLQLLVVRVCLSVFLILKNQQMEYPLHFKKLLQLKYHLLILL